MADPEDVRTGPLEGGDLSEQLGRSYGALLNREIWQLDVEESVPAPPPEIPGEVPRAATATAAATVPEATAPPPLLRIVEALLFVGGAPLTAQRACETIRGLTPAQFTQAIDALNRDYRQQGRPYRIHLQARGYVLTLQARYQPVVEKLYRTPREARLSPQAIDVLALVAYRQPATRQEIDSLRGADSGALLRQLVRRGLVAVVQRGDSAQPEVAYGTTPRFLELFRLRSLEDLPQTQDLQRL